MMEVTHKEKKKHKEKIGNNKNKERCVPNLPEVCDRYFNYLFFVITVVTAVRKVLILQGGRKAAQPKFKKKFKFLNIFKLFVENVLKNMGCFPHSRHLTL